MSTASTSLPALFLERVAQSPERVACRTKRRDQWRDITWSAWAELSLATASGLRALGLQPGDRVAIIASNRFEWVMAELAILLADAIPVSLYPETTPRLTRTLLEEADVRVAFIEGPTQLQKLIDPDTGVAALDHLIYFDDRDDPHDRDSLTIAELIWERGEHLISLNALIERGNRRRLEPTLPTDPDAVAALLFTPGTTGAPHAVPLTHRNLLHQAHALTRVLELGEDDSHLLILPLPHAFARVIVIASMLRGFSNALSGSARDLVEDTARLQPTFLASVPWLFGRVHAKILNDARAVGPIRRAFFEWALDAGLKRRAPTEDAPTRRFDAIQGALARRLVWGKLHDIFGPHLRFFISVGGPLDPNVAAFFDAADLTLLEGYTITEAAGLVAITRPDADAAPDTSAGRPLEAVELGFDDDGQLLLRGPMISPAATHETGWLATGDQVERDAQEHLHVHGRSSDLILLNNGKRVVPRVVEEQLRRHPLIHQALVHGDQRDFLTALIILDDEAAMRWAEEHSMRFEDFASLTQDRRIFEYIAAAVEQVNLERAPRQPIKKFALLEAPFSPETGELTPLLQLRRHFVTARYRSILDSFYSEQY